MMWKSLLLAGAAAGLMTANLSASTILGSFSIEGQIIVNGSSTIDWTDDNKNAMMANVTNGTGIYSVLNAPNTEVTIEDLSSSTEPTGNSGFADTLFIQFAPSTGLAPLYINTIYPGIYTAAQCGTQPPTSGQQCTPPVSGGLSPFNFVNNPPPTNPQATATFAFAGDLGPSNTNDTWIGNFTSQFNVPFQTVLAQLSSTGTVQNSYSAAFTVSANPVSQTPETSTLSLCGLGLGLVLLSRSKSLIGLMRRS